MAGGCPDCAPTSEIEAGGGHLRQRWSRWLYLCLAGVALALAAVGAVLPLLPTTPFLLVALWALSRSHPALAARLYQHPRFGPPLRNWREQRAIGRRAKITALAVLVASAALTAATAPVTVAALSIAMLSLVGLFIVTRPAPREAGHSDDPDSRTIDPV